MDIWTSVLAGPVLVAFTLSFCLGFTSFSLHISPRGCQSQLHILCSSDGTRFNSSVRVSLSHRYRALVQNWAISWRRDNQSRFWNFYGCRGWRNGLIFLGLMLIMPGETGPSCDLLWYQVKRHYIRIKPTQRKVEMKNIKRERENPGFIFRTSRSSYT